MSDDELISEWVRAMHGKLTTGSAQWEARRIELLDEIYRRRLGRRMMFVKLDGGAFAEHDAA